MNTMGGLQAVPQSQAILRDPGISGFQGGGEGPPFRARQDCKVWGKNVKSEGRVKCKKRPSPIPASVAFVPLSVDRSWGTPLQSSESGWEDQMPGAEAAGSAR